MNQISYTKYHRDRDYLENEELFRNIFQKRVVLMYQYIKTKGRVLDVGASTGVMLELFKERGWETWGVEPSNSSQSAKAKGHKILNTLFEKAKLPQNYFDLLILNHTLEHMDDPPGVFKKARGLLKKRGIIFVDVPNAGGLGAKILGENWPYRLPNEHKWQFTKESLSKIFKKTGFEILYWESRSGLFEYSNPVFELWQSLTGLKKRFVSDLISIPYSLIATLMNMGDSMSFIAKKQ